MSQLTEKQYNVYKFILNYHNSHGYPPTIREIGKHFDFSSTGTVRDYLDKLNEKGFISIKKNTARGIIINKNDSSINSNVFLPVLGKIPAGNPIISEEYILEHLPLGFMVQSHNDSFILKVVGNSMINAGILDDDYIIVETNLNIKNNDIIAAMVNGDVTVKRYIKKSKNQIILKPENPGFNDIIVKKTDNFRLIGKVTGIFRKT